MIQKNLIRDSQNGTEFAKKLDLIKNHVTNFIEYNNEDDHLRDFQNEQKILKEIRILISTEARRSEDDSKKSLGQNETIKF